MQVRQTPSYQFLHCGDPDNPIFANGHNALRLLRATPCTTLANHLWNSGRI